MHKKCQNSVAKNTVPDTLVSHTLTQAPVFLACRIRRRLVRLYLKLKPLVWRHLYHPGFPNRRAFLI